MHIPREYSHLVCAKFNCDWSNIQKIYANIVCPNLYRTCVSGMGAMMVWWNHMGTFSALLALCMGNLLVDSLNKGPLMWSFDVSFVVELEKLLNKHLSCWWFEMPWCPCEVIVMHIEARKIWRQFADDIFKWNSVNKDSCILIKISFKFVPKVVEWGGGEEVPTPVR